MENMFYTTNEEYRDKFFRVPKVFTTHPDYIALSNDAKIAWAILRDRHELSIKNGWFDSENKIFFIYSNERLMEILRLSKNTVTKVKKELKKANLIFTKRQGQGKPDKLYLLKPELREEDIYLIREHEEKMEDPNGSTNKKKIKNKQTKDHSFEKHKNWDSTQTLVGVEKRKNWDSKITKIGSLDSQNLSPIDTDIIKTEKNENENLNQNLDHMNKYIWEMKLPMSLKKFFSDKVKDLVNDDTFDIAEIEYFYNTHREIIDPECTREDVWHVNDIEFTKAIKKMYLEVERPIRNMEGLIKNWVQWALHFKIENHRENIEFNQVINDKDAKQLLGL